MLLVNKPGLYRIIMRSDKSEARKFQYWVTHEVLPSIRKTGSVERVEEIPHPFSETHPPCLSVIHVLPRL